MDTYEHNDLLFDNKLDALLCDLEQNTKEYKIIRKIWNNMLDFWDIFHEGEDPKKYKTWYDKEITYNSINHAKKEYIKYIKWIGEDKGPNLRSHHFGRWWYIKPAPPPIITADGVNGVNPLWYEWHRDRNDFDERLRLWPREKIEYELDYELDFYLKEIERLNRFLAEEMFLKKQARKIETWFLECKYNPKYKYCQKWLDDEYDNY
jgi:hypothetical protein